MGNIKFEGSPPYALPIAQHVTARAEGAVVEMTLEVITPGKEPSIVPIKVQMTSDSARSLRAQLQPAITMAEVHERRSVSCYRRGRQEVCCSNRQSVSSA